MGQIENLQQHGRAISSRINNHIKCKWSTLIIRQSLSDCIKKKKKTREKCVLSPRNSQNKLEIKGWKNMQCKH